MTLMNDTSHSVMRKLCFLSTFPSKDIIFLSLYMLYGVGFVWQI